MPGIQHFQSNWEYSFKVTLCRYFVFFTVEIAGKIYQNWARPHQQGLPQVQNGQNWLKNINLSVTLNKCLTYFFAAIWPFLVPLDILKSLESNYTVESVRKVFKQ